MANGESNGDKPSFFRGIHVDPRISIGHFITTFTVAVGMIWWAATLEGRVTNNEQRLAALDERVARSELRQERAMEILRSELRQGFDGVRKDLRALAERIDRTADR